MNGEHRRELTRVARETLADTMGSVALASRALQTAAQRGSKVEMLEAIETWDKSVALAQTTREKCLSLLGEEVEGWMKEA